MVSSIAGIILESLSLLFVRPQVLRIRSLLLQFPSILGIFITVWWPLVSKTAESGHSSEIDYQFSLRGLKVSLRTTILNSEFTDLWSIKMAKFWIAMSTTRSLSSLELICLASQKRLIRFKHDIDAMRKSESQCSTLFAPVVSLKGDFQLQQSHKEYLEPHQLTEGFGRNYRSATKFFPLRNGTGTSWQIQMGLRHLAENKA